MVAEGIDDLRDVGPGFPGLKPPHLLMLQAIEEAGLKIAEGICDQLCAIVEHADFRGQAGADKEPINDDIVFEIELVRQVEINVDYILMLVEKWRAAHGDGTDTEIRASISRAVDASPSLRNRKDLIEAEGLRPEEARVFIETAFRDGSIQATGTAITKVLPPVSKFAPDAGYGEKKQRVLAKRGVRRAVLRAWSGVRVGAAAALERRAGNPALGESLRPRRAVE